MKILIAGITGLLGSNLSKYLESCGETVVGSSRNCEDGYQCDFAVREQVNAFLDKANPEVIINLIALVNVDECEANPNKAFLINTRVAENISDWVVRKGKKTRIIHISTDHVYNNQKHHKEDEADPVNTYAISKYRSEKFVISAGGTVLRTNFFGFHREEINKGFLAYIIRNLKDKNHFYISTKVKFNPLSLESFCEKIYCVIKKPVNDIFNVGSRDGMAKGEFVEEICRIKGFESKYMISESSPVMANADSKSIRPADMRMDCSFFEKTYGVVMPNIRDEIRKVLEHVK